MKTKVDNRFYDIVSKETHSGMASMRLIEKAGKLITIVSEFENYQMATPHEEQWDWYNKLDTITESIADLMIALQLLCARYDIDLNDIEYYGDHILECYEIDS